MKDPRHASPEKLQPPAPLPHVSRKALARVKDATPPPTACPKCGKSPRLVNNREIYGKPYGWWPYAYWCKPCDTMVGLHPDTDLPLGTMADAELRKLRQRSKQLWTDTTKRMGLNRSEAYHWLAEKMEIPREQCHFGMFSKYRCLDAEIICKEQLKCLK